MSKNIEGKVVVIMGARCSGRGEPKRLTLARCTWWAQAQTTTTTQTDVSVCGTRQRVHLQRRPLWHTQILALACRTPAKSILP